MLLRGKSNGYFYCSPDKGDHWFLQPVNDYGYFKSLYQAFFWDENSIAVVGYSGRVLLTDSGIYHSLQTESHLNAEDIAVFPNPSSGRFTIETPDISGNAWTMTLTNTTGQTLMVQPLKSSAETIDASHLPKGVYFIRLQCDRGVVTRRVILN
jgi:hypothetical protein